MSSLNLNKVILVGRITADPELKQTTGGVSVTQFSIAVNRRYAAQNERQADFINVVAWRQTAEFISRYFKKGSAICVTGSIQTRSWQDNQGQRRYATEVVADEAMFVDNKSQTKDDPEDHVEPPEQQVGGKPIEPQYQAFSPDEDLPF